MLHKKHYGTSNIALSMELGASYGASPIYVKGVNLPINKVVKDKKKIKEIEKWYDEYSNADEIVHFYKDLPMKISDEQLKNISKDLKERLIPLGQKLARDIGAVFFIDRCHLKHLSH